MTENIIVFITDMTKSIDNVTETAMKKRLKMLAKQQSCEQRELEVRGQRLSASECRRYSMLDANRPPSKSHDHSFLLRSLHGCVPCEKLLLNVLVMLQLNVKESIYPVCLFVLPNDLLIWSYCRILLSAMMCWCN